MVCSDDTAASANGWSWTPEREAMACRLYIDEGLTASEVALALGGVSRSAVIGKMLRLGCAKRAGEAASKPRERAAPRFGRSAARGWTPRREPSWPPQPLPPLRDAPLQGPPAVLAGLDAGECRWPIDDPGCGHMDRTLFCAAPTAPGPTYCPAHAALAVATPKGRP